VGRAFVKEVFKGRDTMGVGDVVIEGSDINSRHEGFGGKGHDERPNNLEEKFNVFYVGGEGFDVGLELCIDLHLNLPNVLDVNVKKNSKNILFHFRQKSVTTAEEIP